MCEGDDNEDREPDVDGEPSLGGTVDGVLGDDRDLEMGVPPRAPQNRTELSHTVEVEVSYRRFLTVASDKQKARVCARLKDVSDKFGGVIVR